VVNKPWNVGRVLGRSACDVIIGGPKYNRLIHVEYLIKRFPYYSNTASSEVDHGGDGLYIWRSAANMCNVESRTANKGWSLSETPPGSLNL
jgi:hypothetical protein